MSIDWHKIIHSVAELPDMKLTNYKQARKLDHASTHEWFIGFRSLVKDNLKVIELSDDLVWAITRLSLEVPPAILFDYALQARMPFNSLLLTWNGDTRNRSYMEQNIAVLDPTDTTEEHPAMIVTSTHGCKLITDVSYHDKKLFVFPVSYWLDSDSTLPKRKQSFLNHECSDKGEHSLHVRFWLTSYIIAKYPEYANELETDTRFGTHVIPPSGLMMLSKLKVKDGHVHDQADKMKAIISGTAGNPRWFAALCTLMSYQAKSRIAEHVEPVKADEKRGKHSGSHTTWTLFLPREKVVKSAVRHLLINRKPVGKHDVSGFWSMRHTVTSCHHVWPAEPTRRQVCENCGTLRWWVISHQRGTGELVDRKRKMDYSGHLNKVIKDIKESHND